MKKSLYEIGEDMRDLEILLEDIGGEIPDSATESLIDAWLEANAKDLEEKLNGYGKIIVNETAKAKVRRAQADALKEEMQRLDGLATAGENIVTALKSRLNQFFTDRKWTMKETELFKFRQQANGGVAPLVYSERIKEDPRLLPAEYIEDVPKIKTDQLREDLESSEEVERKLKGLVWIGERGTHMRVR